MTGYTVVNLKILIEAIGEGEVKSILSSFSCPLAKDVENFLHKKAIEFAKQSIAQTHLIFTQYKKDPVLVAYFTLANKSISVSSKKLKYSIRRKLSRYSPHDDYLKAYHISAPLIAQLGKNFTNGFDKLITGEDLLAEACKKVSQIQLDLGGKFTYVECEDKPALVQFYKDNGFIEFDKRYLDKDELDSFSSTYLVQMIKYLS